jgi:hypothetical protein
MEELTALPFPFTMQLDETTDISQYSQRLVFVRYVHADAIKEEFLCCGSLLETTKITDIWGGEQHFPNKTLTGKKSFILFAQIELLQCLVIQLVLLL